MGTFNKRIQTIIFILALTIVPVIALGISSKAYAINFPICTWTGNGGDNNFSNAANWSGCGGAPVSGTGPVNSGTYEMLYFDNSSLTQNEVLNNDIGSLVIHGVRFEGSGSTYGFRISGNTLVSGPGGFSVVDNTSSAFNSGFNNTLSISNGSSIFNLYNPSGTYFANIQGSVETYLIGGNGGIMQLANISNLSGVISPISDQIELMPTGDMSSNVIFDNMTNLAFDNQGGDNATYNYDLNINFSNGVNATNAQIYFLNDPNSNIQNVFTGNIGLDYNVDVNSNGSNTLNITGPISDNGYTINSDIDNVASVSVLSGDDQSSGSPTIGANTAYYVDGLLGDVTVSDEGILKGNGTISSADIQPGGYIAPGHSPGCLTDVGDLTLNGTYTADIQSPGVTACTDYDQIIVGGNIDLTGSDLNVNFLNNFAPAVGQSFEIIENNGGNPITSTFSGLPEGAVFAVGNIKLQISYVGDGGNNVVLTVLRPDTPVTATIGAPNTGFGKPKSSTANVNVMLAISSGIMLTMGLRSLVGQKKLKSKVFPLLH